MFNKILKWNFVQKCCFIFVICFLIVINCYIGFSEFTSLPDQAKVMLVFTDIVCLTIPYFMFVTIEDLNKKYLTLENIQSVKNKYPIIFNENSYKFASKDKFVFTPLNDEIITYYSNGDWSGFLLNTVFIDDVEQRVFNQFMNELNIKFTANQKEQVRRDVLKQIGL